MSRKFELPPEFKVNKIGDSYSIIVLEKNPIWVGFYVIIAIGAIYFSFTSHPVWSAIALFALLKIVFEFVKRTSFIVGFQELRVNNRGFQMSEIRDVKLGIDSTTLCFRGGSSEVDKKRICLTLKNDKSFSFGKRMIYEYQIVIIHILKRFKDKDELFVEKHFGSFKESN